MSDTGGPHAWIPQIRQLHTVRKVLADFAGYATDAAVAMFYVTYCKGSSNRAKQ